ncbi:MAG: hypothetical protein OEZ02_15320, partial [Anaerolineae bacterium]|nr:hypothetical protein [Anaerolineae bacterium]
MAVPAKATKRSNNGYKGEAHKTDWLHAAKVMLTARTIDNIEEQELVPAGKIAYQFSSKGHELSQVLLGMAMDHPHDG